MKRTLFVVGALVLIGLLIPFIFADVVPNRSEQSIQKSNSGLKNTNELDEMPVITNEAEYAEFQKQRELANRASSSSSSTLNTVSSHSNKSKATAK